MSIIYMYAIGGKHNPGTQGCRPKPLRPRLARPHQLGARTMMPRILAFAGSTRMESFNKKLVSIAAHGAREAGAEVTLIDLKDFPLPLFDQDLEAVQGPPEAATRLKRLF